MKHSEDGNRTSREELAGNKISEQKEDLMKSSHKGPMFLQGVKGHTTTTTIKCLTLTTHPHLVPRSRMSRSYTSSPAWHLRGSSRTVLLFLLSVVRDLCNIGNFI
jgi:hypothetical protein